ncbi:hypothetical protein IVB04_24600 [Bradyrhizobium sp. 169]|nr:hypothetical protein [Bradyrhizobium sp. 169]
MDERIENEQVASLWQRRQDREISEIAAAKEQHRFRTQKNRAASASKASYSSQLPRKSREPPAPTGVLASSATEIAFFIRGALASAR